ncbi:hypothetical protein HDV57DRAFT_133579 [Trichoderma longibrachiatum]
MQIQVSSSHKSILYIAKCVCHLYTLLILRILAPVNMGHNRLVYLVTSVKSVIIHLPLGVPWAGVQRGEKKTTQNTVEGERSKERKKGRETKHDHVLIHSLPPWISRLCKNPHKGRRYSCLTPSPPLPPYKNRE